MPRRRTRLGKLSFDRAHSLLGARATSKQMRDFDIPFKTREKARASRGGVENAPLSLEDLVEGGVSEKLHYLQIDNESQCSEEGDEIGDL